METYQNLIQQLLTRVAGKLALDASHATIEPCSVPEFGDYTTNMALQAAKAKAGEFKNPRELAEKIATGIREEKADFLEAVEVAGPGFINFKLHTQKVLENLALPKFASNGKKAIIEYMQPNTNKPLHIGHLRNASLGSALINLQTEVGWEVKAATINNDRGLHITKSMWAYLTKGEKHPTQNFWVDKLLAWQKDDSNWLKPDDMEEPKLHKGDFFVGHWYILADKHAEEEAVQKEWQAMLLAWENQNDPLHKAVRALWKQMNDWFYLGVKESYKTLGVKFDTDQVSFESEIYEAGKQIILGAVKKGIFEKLPDGAVRANLEKDFHLPDKILLRRDGTGIYMTFDIELTRQRSAQKADLLVWVVGNDQDLYFRQLFAVSELLGFGKANNFKHFSYGMVRLPEGKMSSRKGTVVYADEVVTEAIRNARLVMDSAGVGKDMTEAEKNEIAREVGIGAVKYTMLSYDPQSEIAFDIDKSVSFEGNSGPYLQYAHARCQSILAKVGSSKETTAPLEDAEIILIHKLEKYHIAISRAANEYAPHFVCTYLMELASNFSRFYSECPVLGNTRRERITKLTSETLEHGLRLLGIAAPNKM